MGLATILFLVLATATYGVHGVTVAGTLKCEIHDDCGERQATVYWQRDPGGGWDNFGTVTLKSGETKFSFSGPIWFGWAVRVDHNCPPEVWCRKPTKENVTCETLKGIKRSWSKQDGGGTVDVGVVDLNKGKVDCLENDGQFCRA